MSENKKYKLLIVGPIGDNHIKRFVRNLRKENPIAQIDFLATSLREPVDLEVRECLSNLMVVNKDFRGLSRFALLRPVYKFLSTRKYLKEIQLRKYDVINIHFPCFFHYFYLNSLRKMTNTILLTPWGSDVYRVNSLERFILKKLYEKSDRICGTGNRFNKDVKRIFDIPEEKFVKLDIGSETIDFISDHLSSIPRDKAKDILGVSGKYVIVCGYNGSLKQNHQTMIEQIHSVLESLPTNTILLFPFTYGGSKQYVEALKNKLNNYGLTYLFFEKYLSLDELFCLRRAADIFIHIQETDANAASVQEYLLAGTKVINGEWLRYKELELNGVLPYFIVKTKEDLGKVLVEVYNSNNIIIPQDTIDYINSYGWNYWIKKWNEFFESTVAE